MIIKKWIQTWLQYATIKRSGYFDSFYYLAAYPDVRRSDVEPLLHFIQYGWREKRNPSVRFETAFYLRMNPDVEQAGINPLIHYIQHGVREGRAALPGQSSLETQNRQSDKALSRFSGFIYQSGKKIYWWVSPRYRRKLVYWSYRHIGFLFSGLPDYEGWRNNLAQERAGMILQQNLLDIDQLPPAEHAGGSIAIHIHLFYRDLIKEFVKYLRNMPFTYDLYISIPENELIDLYETSFDNLPYCNSVKISPVVNRGRDLAPMFCTFGDEIVKHDFVAHLHSKKSIYNKGATEGWREYLCNSLLGSEGRIRRIFGLMQGKKPCGIVYPQNYVFLPYWANTWLANKGLGQIWCTRLGIKDVPQGYFDYPTSSMFWARKDALVPLFQAGIKLVDFPEETGQTDGTLAHCLERLLVLCVQKQNMIPGIIKDQAHPSWSAWRIDQYINRPAEELTQILASGNIKLIAFDIFDSLFCRPLLNPETIKSILSRRIRGKEGRLYLEYRAIAEQQACEAKGLDVGLDQIYDHLGRLSGLSEKSIQKIKQLEIDIEEASLEPRKQALDLYRRALSTGKPVVFISDMFLPRPQIEKWLGRNGFQNWDGIFLSNDIGIRKDSGDLYKHVLAKYAIEPAGLLMIGDNERSDIQIPCDMGAAFIHLFKPVELARGIPRFSNLISSHEHNGNTDAEVTLGMVVRKNFSIIHYPEFDPASLITTEPFNWGYSLVGPLLLSFVQWLYKNAQDDGVARLYFLSREGKSSSKSLIVGAREKTRRQGLSILWFREG